MVLDGSSLRILGALMEKETITPDAYPLSLNSLIAAANQRSSRDPVTDLSEDEVRTALHRLQAQDLVAPAREASRVSRYEHRIRTVLSLRRDETAVLCLLMLRGPQTTGELRSRSDRMHSFEDLGAVQATLDRLQARETPLVTALARSPGSRETRWMQLLGGPHPTERSAATDGLPPSAPATRTAFSSEAISDLQASVESLERRIRILEEYMQQSTKPQGILG